MGSSTSGPTGAATASASWATSLELRALLRENPADVILVHEPLNPALGYWGTWLAPRTPHVATFHAFGEIEPPALRVTRAMMAPLVRPFFQRAIAVSEPARRWAAPSWRFSKAVPIRVERRERSPGEWPSRPVAALEFVLRRREAACATAASAEVRVELDLPPSRSLACVSGFIQLEQG
jgi:hypothetical protein